MMNDTVARIVEIMFQDTEMTEEVAAIRDEVMNNCQERYEDMLSRGMSQDDAVAAVIESLKGMEEVIAQYPKKSHTAAYAEGEEDWADAEADEEVGESPSEYVFHEGGVKSIDLTLVNEDVNIERSCDQNVRVTVEGEDTRAVTVHMNGSKLTIERTPDYQRVVENGQAFTAHKGSVEFNGVHIDLEKTSGLESLGHMLGKLFKNFKIQVNGASAVDRVTIAIPDHWQGAISLMTTSGNVEIEDLSAHDLRAVTTNGDINVSMEENSPLTKAEIISTSGDIDATFYADLAILRTTSGDIELEGRIRTLNVSTISGDIDIRADVADCTFKAISGDIDMEFDSDELRSINGTTISGDVDITLPSGIGSVGIQTHTISGDVTTHCHTNGYGPCVMGSISTTSGDIDLR